ncbi:MAG: ankyrin repeat domain-containing protein [Labilithrix sp.]|nr:ankyrin repeat domain-containing protein [Labilithrix sp.]MCW5817196.1 ankyrin repeat domain-containing protein [Labilithrix sp.]
MSEDLLLYAQLGRADRIARLVAGGVDPDWRREDGVTTLMMAAMTGRLEVMSSLIDCGATIDLQAPDGTTALLAACAYARTTRDIAGVELLLARGADPNLGNTEGNDALMLCARHGLVEGVVALVKAGAKPNRANRHGSTALMQAARGHLVETVRVLLRAGADRALLDENGLNASRYAYEVGPPPPELSILLAPSDLGSLELSHSASRFDRPEFKIKLLGSWNETEGEGSYEYLEVTGERQIVVSIVNLPEELDPDERQDAIARNVAAHNAQTRAEAEGAEVRFTEVRFHETPESMQARWTATSMGGNLFVANAIYALPTRFVSLSYRDYRPNLSDETRGRQAGESVASFRVK